MSLKRRTGWGAVRAALAVATSDMLAIMVPATGRTFVAALTASFLMNTPGPAEEAGHARVVLYTGTEPVSLAALGPDLVAQGVARQVWLDHWVRYGRPLELAWPVWSEPIAQPGEHLWLAIGPAMGGDGIEFDATASLGLWGFDEGRREHRSLGDR